MYRSVIMDGEERKRDGDMQEVRIRVEHIHILQVGKKRVYLPSMSSAIQTPADKRRSRIRRRRQIVLTSLILSALVTVAVYTCLGILAYVARGYYAIGGELFAAVAMGIYTYAVLVMG